MIINSADSIGSPDLQFLSVPVTDTVQCGKSFKANNVTVTELQVCTQKTYHMYLHEIDNDAH